MIRRLGIALAVAASAVIGVVQPAAAAEPTSPFFVTAGVANSHWDRITYVIEGFTASVIDRTGRPVTGVTMNFSVDRGGWWWTLCSAKTDTNGVATCDGKSWTWMIAMQRSYRAELLGPDGKPSAMDTGTIIYHPKTTPSGPPATSLETRSDAPGWPQTNHFYYFSYGENFVKEFTGEGATATDASQAAVAALHSYKARRDGLTTCVPIGDAAVVGDASHSTATQRGFCAPDGKTASTVAFEGTSDRSAVNKFLTDSQKAHCTPVGAQWHVMPDGTVTNGIGYQFCTVKK